MSFAIYLIGAVIFLGGIAWGMATLNVPTHYIAITVLIVLGICIFTGVSRTRAKDPSGT
jgi:membrane-bound acyltransferase YfiQ involved in biofilm formation